MKYITGVILVVSFFLLGCPGKPKPVVDPAETTTEDSSVSESQTDQSEQQIVAEKLEKKRKNVEDMINKIMEEDVYFDFDTHMLSEKARDILSRIGDILMEEKEFGVIVEGHTDEVGTEAYNMSLGGKRAKAVFSFLVDYGVDQSRLKTMSFGEEKPKATGTTDTDRELNRRAHFKVEVIK
jgi:peptidoglycan-associated lipoprotein